MGLAVGRGVGTAVKRNRAKRLLRAAMQSLIGMVTPGCDLVLIARAPLPASDYFEVRQALIGLLRRARVIESA